MKEGWTVGWAENDYDDVEGQDIGVFAFATRSQMDRDVPRGFHPSVVMVDGAVVEVE